MEDSSIAPDKTYYFDEHKKLEINPNSPALEAIAQIDAEYLSSPLDHFRTISEAMRSPVKDGPPYAIFKDADSSQDTALVVALPFASSLLSDVSSETTAAAIKNGEPRINANNWHNAEKHYALFRILKAMGVTDSQGKNIPVIAIASPSKDWHPVFSKLEKESISHGDFSPFSRHIGSILDQEGFGQIHIGGYSMGAAIGHSATHSLANQDVLSATLGEPTNYKGRSRWQMTKNYILNRPAPPNNSGIKSGEKWTVSGPQSRTDLEAFPNRWEKNIVLQGINNGWAIVGGLDRPTMFSDLDKALPKSEDKSQIIPVTIEYGSGSSVTHDIEQYLSTSNEVLARYSEAHRLRIVKAMGHEAVGAPHLHGESPLFYGLWMAESILWALEASKEPASS